ncbi:unnamed protein product, partial [Musa hybrid cultivar]
SSSSSLLDSCFFVFGEFWGAFEPVRIYDCFRPRAGSIRSRAGVSDTESPVSGDFVPILWVSPIRA